MTPTTLPAVPEHPAPSVTTDTPASPGPGATALLAGGVALAHLGLVAAGGITRLVATTHATIARSPLKWKQGPAPAEKAPLPYQLVARSFVWLASLAQRMSRTLPAPPEHGLWRSALNGVVGHTLAELDSPLAQGMSLRDEFGNAITGADWVKDGRRGLVLFVHGLCLSEREWQNHTHAGFVRELREFGHGVAWLRYNTGHAIADNGTALSDLLEQLPAHNLPITLVGHSMGGLVIRAAGYHAEIRGAGWISRLANAVYLGTPHHGAPGEQLGHAANRLLGLTPYTKSFMSLGNIRSRGIRDLREGRVVPEHKANPYRLVNHARHLLIAGHMGCNGQRHFMGDGMVPVRSALGQHVEAHRALHAKDVTRLEFEQLGHMQLLKDERVYQALLEWLKP
jgi:pimeloyl-ACP methyl ester carboxylesterase